MARKDLIEYYLEQQAVYLEMLKDIKDVDKDHKDGLIDDERYEQLMASLSPEIEPIKANYERISYCVLLLNKPARKSKGKKYENVNKDLYEYLQGASKEAVLDESKDALADLKKIIKESKENK